jgi:hypothetical protein
MAPLLEMVEVIWLLDLFFPFLFACTKFILSIGDPFGMVVEHI